MNGWKLRWLPLRRDRNNEVASDRDPEGKAREKVIANATNFFYSLSKFSESGYLFLPAQSGIGLPQNHPRELAGQQVAVDGVFHHRHHPRQLQ